ncbi:MAG: substrate-binding domain-containing protein, partial [Tepidisphaeraceae bacterium]
RRIGLVLGGRAPVFLTDRLQGYLRGIEAVGRAPEAALRWVGDADNVPPTPRRAEEAIDAVVGRGNADAIVASNDLWAIHLVKALRRRGLRVPDDVAVVGFDNIEAAALSDPALTTVDQDNAAFAEAAVDLALRSVHEPEQIKPEQRTVIVRPRLVVRESA